MPEPPELLTLRGVRALIRTNEGVVRAVDGVSFTLRAGRTLGIVGESGCGKSVLSLSIMRLLTEPAVRLEGEILFRRRDGRVVDLARLDPLGPEMRALRGREMAMVFQEPMTALNPIYTVGEQIEEAIRLHERTSRAAARRRAVELLRQVGIADPEARVDAYPHELSGGMRQRVVIAMALSCRPRLLICDEPTTALDVTVQAQILDLLRRVQAETGASIILITHDFGVVAAMADDIAVMYLGEFVESAPASALFARPAHPYTQGLLRSRPPLDASTRRRLDPIPGTVPAPTRLPEGCRFAPRCPARMARCSLEPPQVQVGPDHLARCWVHASPSGARGHGGAKA